MIKNLKAKNGWWSAHVVRGEFEDWGERVFEIKVVHEDYSKVAYALNQDCEALAGEVGVDSGQAGIFDQSQYPNGPRSRLAAADDINV
jgi:hypothetical protein